MKRPTLLMWLIGRAAYPPGKGRCVACGEPGADPNAASRLEDAGPKGWPSTSMLCENCRKRHRDAAILRSL